MTAADEIHYNDLSLLEQAALDAAVIVRDKAVADGRGIAARVDADEV